MDQQSLKILVRGTNWLGDAVMSIPALNLLRREFPSARITIVASPVSAGLFTSLSVVDELIVYQRKERGAAEFLRLLARLRKCRFDLAILFQNAFEAALLAALAGIPHRIGYRTQGRGILLNPGLDRRQGSEPRHQIHDYLDLVRLAVRRCKGAPGVDIEPRAGLLEPLIEIGAIKADPGQIEASRALLPDARSARLVALNVGATNSRAKRWPEESFAELADRLTADFGVRVVLLGSGTERPIAARVNNLMRGPSALNLAGQTDLPALLGILSRCDLVVTNDTGSAHVAAALGRPTLTLFGPTNEFETAPLGPHSEIIRAENIECARCMLRDCPIDHRCMTRITARDVLNRASRFLVKVEPEGSA